MFTDDVDTTDIEGKKYYTFQPNTIVYAVDVNSDLGKKIKNAKIGVVWHTTYKGNALQDMKASFGANISGLNNPASVWMDDATYKGCIWQGDYDTIRDRCSDEITIICWFYIQNYQLWTVEYFLNLQNSFTGKLVWCITQDIQQLKGS